MIKSMTGYGKTTCEINNKTISIEIKSLNSKQTDVYTKLPNIYKEKDIEIRNILINFLKRGKIELNITIDNNGSEQAAQINTPVVKEYFNQFTTLQQEMKVKTDEPILQIIFRLPEALKTVKEEVDESEWSLVKVKIAETAKLAENYRAQEGISLEKDIMIHLDNIEKNLNTIVKYEDLRISKIKDRINNSVAEFFSEENIDKNRFEQELIYYLEKLDITEEKVRLGNHCNYFREVIREEEQAGKKLGFISQEIGREINTIGSKANDFEIQRLVVLMKDELEKIKEQLMNIL